MTKDPARSVEMTRSEERFDVRTETVVYDRVRVRRRVVVETRNVLVEVRREELVLESVLPGGAGEVAAGAIGTGVAGDEPLVVVLHQEVPEFVLRTEAYERVTVTKQILSRNQPVVVDVSHEVIDLEQEVTDGG